MNGRTGGQVHDKAKSKMLITKTRDVGYVYGWSPKFFPHLKKIRDKILRGYLNKGWALDD